MSPTPIVDVRPVADPAPVSTAESEGQEPLLRLWAGDCDAAAA